MTTEAAAKEFIFSNSGQLYHSAEEFELKDAIAFSGRWTSRSLLADSLMDYYTLNDLLLRYKGVGEIRVRYTKDGGSTWTPESVVLADNSLTAIFRPHITGRDIRFEIILPNRNVVVTAYRVRIVKRSSFNAK